MHARGIFSGRTCIQYCNDCRIKFCRSSPSARDSFTTRSGVWTGVSLACPRCNGPACAVHLAVKKKLHRRIRAGENPVSLPMTLFAHATGLHSEVPYFSTSTIHRARISQKYPRSLTYNCNANSSVKGLSYREATCKQG